MKRPAIIIVAVSDGHGMETRGKCSPKLPDGRVIKENEFNQLVATFLINALNNTPGFKGISVSPGDTDVPLEDRIAAAEKANAHLYVSIHANASAKGTWHTSGGIEVYCYPGSKQGKLLAACIHDELIKGTPQRDRGVKEANFMELRETLMPAALVEALFMDDKNEVNLMLNTDFQKETALEILAGIQKFCSQYFF